MYKCHNYHAIFHKLYTRFGKNELRLYLNGAKISSIGGAPPAPSKYAHYDESLIVQCFILDGVDVIHGLSKQYIGDALLLIHVLTAIRGMYGFVFVCLYVQYWSLFFLIFKVFLWCFISLLYIGF